MDNKKKIYIAVAVAIILALAGVLFFLNKDVILRDHQQPTESSLIVGVLPTEDCLPLYVAEHLELVGNDSSDVFLKHFMAFSECRHAIENKTAHAAVLDTILYNIIQKEGISLSRIYSTPVKWQLLTSKKSRIKRTAQLTDKILIADRYGATYQIARGIADSLRNNSLHVVQVEDLSIRLSMLLNGSADAAILLPPFSKEAIARGAMPISTQYTEHPVYTNILAIRKDALTREEQYQALQNAINIAKDSIARFGEQHYLPLLK